MDKIGTGDKASTKTRRERQMTREVEMTRETCALKGQHLRNGIRACALKGQRLRYGACNECWVVGVSYLIIFGSQISGLGGWSKLVSYALATHIK